MQSLRNLARTMRIPPAFTSRNTILSSADLPFVCDVLKQAMICYYYSFYAVRSLSLLQSPSQSSWNAGLFTRKAWLFLTVALDNYWRILSGIYKWDDCIVHWIGAVWDKIFHGISLAIQRRSKTTEFNRRLLALQQDTHVANLINNYLLSARHLLNQGFRKR